MSTYHLKRPDIFDYSEYGIDKLKKIEIRQINYKIVMMTHSIWLIIKVLIILFIIVYLLYLRYRMSWYRSEYKQSLKILKNRFDKGEITQKQYEELKTIIESVD